MANENASLADRVKSSFGGWLMAHMDLMFAIARNTIPILVVTVGGKKFAVVTRFDDVQEVLNRPNAFNVIYEPKLRVIMDGDNIFLGMADVEQATRDRATMRLTAPRREALTRVKPKVTDLAENVLAVSAGRVDLAMELTQSITTAFFCDYFGTPPDDPVALADLARLLFEFMFADFANDPAMEESARPAAAKMRAFVENAIAKRKENRGAADDILERCLQLQDIGTPGMDDRGIRNNMIGLIVGGLPQPPMLVPQLFDVLLDRPAELAAAQAAARADDDALVSRYVFEALRYNPLTPGLFREATVDYTLAGGAWRARKIAKGTRVFAATRSAMFDGRRVHDPKRFRLDRNEYEYMHFGSGMHECFGLYMNREMLPAICKAVLKRPGLRRASGEAGRLRMQGIFAMNLTVEFDS